MEVSDTFPLYIATIAVFAVSLVLGVVLLRLRDFVFGADIGSLGDHHIDFNKKIEEEEQLNLDEMRKSRRCRNVSTVSITNFGRS